MYPRDSNKTAEVDDDAALGDICTAPRDVGRSVARAEVDGLVVVGERALDVPR
jgi:hypothetical protein